MRTLTSKGKVVAAYAEGKTLEQIGVDIGRTNERVRQILISQGIKLRKPGPRGGFKFKPSFGRLTTRERFRKRITVVFETTPEGVVQHWIWDKRNSNGYGYFRVRGRSHYAHRAAFIVIKGRPARGRTHRVCNSSSYCVNPDHWQEKGPQFS